MSYWGLYRRDYEPIVNNDGWVGEKIEYVFSCFPGIVGIDQNLPNNFGYVWNYLQNLPNPPPEGLDFFVDIFQT